MTLELMYHIYHFRLDFGRGTEAHPNRTTESHIPVSGPADRAQHQRDQKQARGILNRAQNHRSQKGLSCFVHNRQPINNSLFDHV